MLAAKLQFGIFLDDLARPGLKHRVFEVAGPDIVGIGQLRLLAIDRLADIIVAGRIEPKVADAQPKAGEIRRV